MARTITATLDDDPRKLVLQAKEAASQNGIIFDGDHESGSYSGFGLKGEYHIQNQEITLNIIKKPAFLPWNIIETKIKQFFEQQA